MDGLDLSRTAQSGSWDVDTLDDIQIEQGRDKPYKDKFVNDDNDYDDEIETVEHDQLPSVEQVRANAHLNDKYYHSSSSSCRRCLSWICIISTIVILVVVGFIVGLKKDSFSVQKGISGANEQAAAKYLQASISDPRSFEDPESPQVQALKWMIHKDPLKLSIPKTSDEPKDTPFVQRYIVTVFVMAFVPTNVRKDLKLLTNSHECTWNSEWKRTDGSTLRMGFFCNDAQQINKIVIQTLGLLGEVPVETYFLKQLNHLALDSNTLQGEIPMIPALTHLSLSFNQLTGTVPDYIGQMTRLEHLNLSENQLLGYIPTGMEKLAENLQYFSILGNELVGGLHSIFQLSNLEELYMGYNSLDGGLSNDSFHKMSNLRILKMNNNKVCRRGVMRVL